MMIRKSVWVNYGSNHLAASKGSTLRRAQRFSIRSNSIVTRRLPACGIRGIEGVCRLKYNSVVMMKQSLALRIIDRLNVTWHFIPVLLPSVRYDGKVHVRDLGGHSQDSTSSTCMVT